jgi:hypothetical protein
VKWWQLVLEVYALGILPSAVFLAWTVGDSRKPTRNERSGDYFILGLYALVWPIPILLLGIGAAGTTIANRFERDDR